MHRGAARHSSAADVAHDARGSREWRINHERIAAIKSPGDLRATDRRGACRVTNRKDPRRVLLSQASDNAIVGVDAEYSRPTKAARHCPEEHAVTATWIENSGRGVGERMRHNGRNVFWCVVGVHVLPTVDEARNIEHVRKPDALGPLGPPYGVIVHNLGQVGPSKRKQECAERLRLSP